MEHTLLERDEELAPSEPRTETRRLPLRRRVRRTLAPRDRALQLGLLVALLALWEIFGRRASNFTFAPPSCSATGSRR
jgi:hypothetical protein